MYYFVRHGRTLLNEQGIKQGADGALAEVGKAQARELGSQLLPTHIQHIYTSPYERARETAEIIRTTLHKGVTVTSLLAERRNASEVIGKSTEDKEVARIVSLTDLRFHDDDYRFSDEENFEELAKRARKCLRYLEAQPYTRTCIVTHHAILHMMLSAMLLGRQLTAVNYVKLSFFNPAANGGITVCVYHPWRAFFGGKGWEILSYNE
jgi:broad specificity phosphatase PhoE